MDIESLKSDWAMWLALASLIVAIVMLTPQLIKRTSRSKLHVVLADLKQVRKERRNSIRTLEKAEKRVRKLTARADRVKPRVLQAAQEAVEDAQALAKIISDKIMIAENQVGLVIHEEFPPARQERMREKYLSQDGKDKRPISF